MMNYIKCCNCSEGAIYKIPEYTLWLKRNALAGYFAYYAVTSYECICFCQKKEQENMLDEKDGVHILFGMVIVPYILYLLDEKRDITLKKMSDFLEKMARCDDIKVQEVLDFTILEQLADEWHERMEQCKKYMQEKTLEHCM